MSTTVQSGAAIQDLARSLVQAFDRNSDGQLTTEEFTSFLSNLLSGIQANGLLASPIGAQSAAPAGAADVRFEGFNFSRAQNPDRSAKDAFAAAALRSGWMPQTKAEAEAWFNQHIRPEMERLGYRINWVRGDVVNLVTYEGTCTVDFVRGAGGPDPALAWQTQ